MVTTKAAARRFAQTATVAQLRAEARRVRREADRLYEVSELLDDLGDDLIEWEGAAAPAKRTRSTGPSAKKPTVRKSGAKKAASKKATAKRTTTAARATAKTATAKKTTAKKAAKATAAR